MTSAFFSCASIVAIRPSRNDCSCLASSYSAFSVMSPSSLASWMRAATRGRSEVMRCFSSAFRRRDALRQSGRRACCSSTPPLHGSVALVHAVSAPPSAWGTDDDGLILPNKKAPGREPDGCGPDAGRGQDCSAGRPPPSERPAPRHCRPRPWGVKAMIRRLQYARGEMPQRPARGAAHDQRGQKDAVHAEDGIERVRSQLSRKPMASTPAMVAAANPAPIASHSVDGMRLAVEQVAGSVDAGPQGDGRGQQEAEARRRLAGQAERQPGD